MLLAGSKNKKKEVKNVGEGNKALPQPQYNMLNNIILRDNDKNSTKKHSHSKTQSATAAQNKMNRVKWVSGFNFSHADMSIFVS